MLPFNLYSDPGIPPSNLSAFVPLSRPNDFQLPGDRVVASFDFSEIVYYFAPSRSPSSRFETVSNKVINSIAEDLEY